jgi:amino acid adenylation domain-containing protein
MPVETGKVLLIGVGGSGMLPLALLLQEAGYQVAGIDPALTPARRNLLQGRGIVIHDAPALEVLAGVQQVIASPAVPQHHPLLRAARRNGQAINWRPVALAALLAARPNIAVAGSHGKSTTTAMLVNILSQEKPDTGYFLGAEVSGRLPARWGDASSDFVFEACEAHGALSAWQPDHLILTNLDDDHAAHYGGQAGLEAAFLALARRIPADGSVVVCGDDARLRGLTAQLDRPATTYGFHPDNLLSARSLPSGQTELVWKGQNLGPLHLRLPGQHNLLNAMAALAMACERGVAPTRALAALATFSGVDRRLQDVGPATGPRILDDFAHHPTEIAASIVAMRGARGRVVAVLQPQLGSRVRNMAEAFARALAQADWRLVLPVETLGEPIQNGEADRLLREACTMAGSPLDPVANVPDLLRKLKAGLLSDDVVIVMAGRSGEGLAQQIAATCAQKNQAPETDSVVYGRKTDLAPDLITAITARAAARPDTPAVQMGRRVLSYGQLMARSGDLALALRAKGVRSGQPVAVCLGRNVDRVTAFLAILRLGAVYLPIDPQQPADRIEMMLRDSAARHVIVNATSPALPDLGLALVNTGNLSDREVQPADLAPLTPWGAPLQPQDAAYLIYTSGSTGRPKGVLVEHGNIASFAAAAAGHFAITPDARVSLVTGFGFDVSVGDMAMTLAAGGCLVLPTDIEALPGSAMARFLRQGRITHLSTTPSALTMVPAGDFPDLACVIVIGEVCPPALVDRWAKGQRFFNAYGPTEATVEATFAACRAGEPVTIGRPFDNMAACVLDADLKPVPRGGAGELGLFGRGVARGYLNQPDLTAARFVRVMMPDGSDHRVYLTGDRAVMEADGALRFLGRLDDQIKFRGHRIEPGEVEAVLCDFPMIREASLSKAATGQTERLIAHVVLHPEVQALDHLALKAHLENRLPAYMHPAVILPIAAFPRTANGKLDRSDLPVPPAVLASAPVRTPHSVTERRLLELLRDIDGGIAMQGVRESLGDAGLDSLGLAGFIMAIESDFGIILDLSLEVGGDTIEALGIAVEQRMGGQPPPKDGSRGGALAAALRPYLTRWQGARKGMQGLVHDLDAAPPTAPALFWCFQSGDEFAALTAALGERVRLFGLRSGHLVFDYDTDTVAALAALYADEIEAVHRHGILTLGGNCQGGMVMAEVAQELRRRGRQVALTVLMEQGRFHPLAGQVLLLFGARSYLNPYGQIDAPERLFRQAYGDGFRVGMLPGDHGQYFEPANVGALADVLAARIAECLCCDAQTSTAAR